MKQKDIVTIIVSVITSAILSFIICSKVIASPKTRQQKVEVVAPISSEFKIPDKAIFNADAVNPTKLIQIGPNSNNQPFSNQ